MLAFTVAAFVVHVVLNVFMVFRFIRGVKALAQVHTYTLYTYIYIYMYIYVCIMYMYMYVHMYVPMCVSMCACVGGRVIMVCLFRFVRGVKALAHIHIHIHG